MVLEVWPTSLPQAFQVSGYGESTPKDNIITDGYDVGPPQYRRRTTSVPAPYMGQMFMTTAEWETLSTFFHTTLFDGVMRFLFPPQGVADLARFWISRFVSPPVRRMSDADDGWMVSLSLERLGIGKAFIIPSRFSDPTIIYTPTVSWDQFFAPARYNNSNTIYPAGGLESDQFVIASLYSNTNSLYATVVTEANNQFVIASLYSSTNSLYAPQVTSTGGEDSLQLEDGTFLLLEDGSSRIILE